MTVTTSAAVIPVPASMLLFVSGIEENIILKPLNLAQFVTATGLGAPPLIVFEILYKQANS